MKILEKIKAQMNKYVRYIAVILLIMVSGNVYSQNTDSTNLPFPIRHFDNPLLNQRYNSPLYLKLPSDYTQDVQYNPLTGNFEITPKVGNFSTGRPTIMTFDEYNQFRNNATLRNNWHANTQRQASDNTFLNNFLSPQINIGVEGLDKIFGSDEISVVPTGNIDISLGFSYYNIDNPALSRRARRNINFDFNQQIQLGVNGKVGDKMNVGINYNTQAMFNYENRKKIDYNGKEDEIIQKIEAGDITFPLDNTLIPGSSTLFGILTELKFGRMTVTNVLSQQKGESKTIEVQGGAVLNDFELSASDYEEDKHFFLNHYFRDNYEKSMQNLPLVTTSAKVTRIEVWVTNKTSDFQDARDVVAFMDLGEGVGNIYSDNVIFGDPSQQFPSNHINNLYELMTTTYSGIRQIANVSNVLSGVSQFSEGVDFVKLEGARRLKDNEFTLNSDLGYLSLNYRLKPGEVLAVAFEYTVNGETYQVGEFSNDIEAPNTLILKMLRGPASVPNLPTWDLMMKNIYSLNTYSLSKDDFSLEVIYNNDQLGTKTNFIPEGDIAEDRLLKVFRFDNADQQNNPNPDGFFDFIEGITVDTRNGLIIFPELEPFGDFLADKIGNPQIAKKYTFSELYDSTQYIAQQTAVKNKFYLKGKYKSSGGNEIMLNVFNVPQGAVKVTQGGAELTENVDYSVDYNIGKVTILNESLLRSGMPIKISLESNDQFGMTTKNLVGTHLNYQFSDNFNLGATYMHLSELPVDPKTHFGIEPISNSIYGFNTNFSHEVPFFTQMVDFLPFIETKAPSTLTFSAEFAQLVPGNPRFVKKRFGANGVSFIDDFEQSQTFIDLKAPQAWMISSIPQGQPDLFPEAVDGTTVASGYNRAKIAWYDISDDLTSAKSPVRPSYITLNDISNHYVRQIMEKEIFPNKQYMNGFPTRMSVLNLAYYPSMKGPYNYDVAGMPGVSAGIDDNGNLNNPQSRWAGIMRSLYITDFESSNIGFIEFWVLDPFIYDSTSTGGDLYLDLGDISEDILKDSRKSRENGIPYPSDPTQIDTTQWGIVTRQPMITQNFSNDANARKVQDVGLDGLGGNNEGKFFYDYLQAIAQLYGVNSIAYQNAANDPSNDNFRFYLNDYYDSLKTDVLTRYLGYNGLEGNSAISGNSSYSAVSQLPDMEDVNRDNTLDNYEAYYQYHIHLSPDDMQVGQNYIVNKIETTALGLANNDKNQRVTWYQFKIPVHSPDRVVGPVQGFKSIRFMRLFMTNFQDPTILRFAKFNLIRDEWREYEYNITQGGEGTIFPQQGSNGTLDISVVNYEESSQKEPVNYVLPPGVIRNSDFYGQQPIKQNEQAMSLKVLELPDGEAKAVYKTLDMDLRKYNKLQMYVHAEALIDDNTSLTDNDLCLFVRIGSDFTENYYEYEIPLKLTPAGHYVSNEDDSAEAVRYVVWPNQNRLYLSLQYLLDIKQQRNIAMASPNSNVSFSTPYEVFDGKNTIKVVGNPNLANVKVMMIGVRNPRRDHNFYGTDDGANKSAEIWVNELRLTDFNGTGGWAANTQINANFADFANVTFSGNIHTPGFGSLEKRVNERYTDQTLEYDLTSQIQFGKFFPTDYRVSIPVYVGFSQSYSNPEYNPFDPDIKFQDALDVISDSAKTDLKNAAQTFTQRRSFNITNFNIQGKQRTGGGSHLVAPWKISNFSASLAFNEIFTRTPLIEFNYQQNMMYGFNYNYAPNSKVVSPFKRSKLFRKRAFAIIKDFNFYYLPTRINFSTEVNRQYISFKNRNISGVDINLPVSIQKNFLWNRNYDVSYKLTNNLKLDFTASNRARIEPDGWRERETLFEQWNIKHPQDTIFLNMYDLGRNTDYTQQIKINYRVPINKLPLLRWTSLTANYVANYDWRRGQDEFIVPATDTTPEYTLNFGNTIQNTATLRLDGRLNFANLYKSVKYLKQVDARFTAKGRTPVQRQDKDVVFSKSMNFYANRPKYIVHNLKTDNITKVELKSSTGQVLDSIDYEIMSPNKIKIVLDSTLKNIVVTIEGKRKMPENPFIIATDYTLKTMMMVQSVSINYKKAGGSLINGYMPQGILFGSEKINEQVAPGWKFLAGLQDYSIIDRFADYNWLTTDTLFNLPLNFTDNEEIRVKVNVEPLNNVKIDFNFQRNITLNQTNYGHVMPDGNFDLQTQMRDGNFFISFNTIKSSFEKLEPGKDSVYHSDYYDNFLNSRQQIANRMAADRHKIDPTYDNTQTYIDSSGNAYPVGYSAISQDVLISSFLAAYSGMPVDKMELSDFPTIPLPDWRLTFDGLSNLPIIKDYVKKLTMTHSYQSTYTVSNFRSNPNFDYNLYDDFGYSDVMYESNGLFIPNYEISGIMISEKFVPFIGFDITWNNSLTTRIEYKKARDLFLSFSNNQVRERHNNSVTVGAGYTIKDIGMNVKVNGAPKHIQSDLNLRLDLTAGKDIELYRKVVENITPVINTSRNNFTLSFTADYSINNNLSLQFFFNDAIMETNTAPRTTNAQGGFKVRYALTP